MRPKTQEEKEMQGTFEPSKEDLSPISHELYDKAPNVPKEWPLDAQVIWRDVCQVLKAAGYLNKGITLALRELCWFAYRRELAESKLLETPTDMFWTKELHENSKGLERLLQKFGMTPADMYRVPAVKKAEGKEMSLLK
jgi:hypothetical protein